MTAILDEEWRPIPGFPGYSVSNLGRVKSHARTAVRNYAGGRPSDVIPVPERILKLPPGKGGYGRFNARRDGRAYHLFIHQVVMLAFVGPPGDGQEVRHLDGDHAHSALNNLAYGTRAENIADAKRHGTFPLLENRPGAKLTRQQALEIAHSSDTLEALAARYGVRPGTVSQIRRGETWKSITEGARKSSYRPRGVSHHKAKITEEVVRMIRQSRLGERRLAKQFGVSARTIHNIRHRRVWKHVNDE